MTRRRETVLPIGQSGASTARCFEYGPDHRQTSPDFRRERAGQAASVLARARTSLHPSPVSLQGNPMARRKSNGTKPDSSANLGFEAKLWLAADKLRNNMDAAEYKHVVLGLIFLKYISDTFEEHRAKLVAGEGDYAGANPEDPDEYKAENVFWVPAEARWSHLQASAKQPTIGKIVDDAMVAIERDNPRLKGVAAQGLRPPRPRQAPPRRTHRPHRHHRAHRRQRGREPTAPSICSAASTSISSPASPAPRARTAASSTPRPASCAAWSRCSPPTRAASTTPAAAPAACSCSRKSSSKPTAASSATSASTARRATPPPAASPS